MKGKVVTLVAVSMVGLVCLQCGQGANHLRPHLGSLPRDTYYSEEVVPANYRELYGQWQLFAISGGFSGGGYEPDFDFIEFRRSGIYGLVRGDTLFEYGKIVPDAFDPNTKDFFQVKFVADYYAGYPYFDQEYKYVDLSRVDTLFLVSPCCDMYNYHFRKVR